MMSGRKLIVALSVVVSLFLIGSTASGAIIYVDDDASPGGDGQTWATAYKYLQDALAIATSGDQLWVAAGTYKPDEDELNPTGSGARSATFQLINGVALYGGFVGNEDPGTFNLANRNFEKNESILSGDLNDNDGSGFTNRTDNSYHIITYILADTTAILDGFIITKGNADEYAGNRDSGGGVFCYYSSPSLENCIFRDNKAYYGGGMYSIEEVPMLINCSFNRNKADEDGGGLFNDYCSINLNLCSFSYNQANRGGGLFNDYCNPNISYCYITGNQADRGGGFYNNVSNAIVDNSSISWNTAGIDGGGIYNNESNPSLNNCIFNNNTAENRGGGMYNDINNSNLYYCNFFNNAAGSGGAIFFNNSQSKVIRSKFIGNSSTGSGGGVSNNDSNSVFISCDFYFNSVITSNGDYGGGGMYNDNSAPYIYGCQFNGNTVTYNKSPQGKGGGIFDRGGSSSCIVNCLFQENLSEYAGCLYSNSSSPLIINSIFWGNHDSHYTGDIYGDSDTRAYNCIFWENVTGIDRLQISRGGASIEYSCIQGGYTGVGNISDNPMFIDPDGPDNIPGTEDDNFHLAPGSPCIDAGDNTAIPADTHDLDEDSDTAELIPWDFEQQPRFYDDPDVTDTGNGTPPIVDMGVYEKGIGFCGDYNHPQPEGDLTGDCRVDLADVAILAAEWLSCTAPVCD